MADAHDNSIALAKFIALESERIKMSSGEHLWVCQGKKPPLLPNLPVQGDNNELRRAFLTKVHGGNQDKDVVAPGTQFFRRPDGSIGDLEELNAPRRHDGEIR